MSIGENIMHWRKKRNLSQSQLACKIDVSQAYISELEKNKRNPTIKILKRIAEALEICTKELIPCDCPACK
jgi:transcriptional regulator with XRE-family HTH domain